MIPDDRLRELLTRAEVQAQAAPNALSDVYERLELERRRRTRRWGPGRFAGPVGLVGAAASLVIVVGGIGVLASRGAFAPNSGGVAPSVELRPLPGYVGVNVVPDWLVPQNSHEIGSGSSGTSWSVTYGINVVGDGTRAGHVAALGQIHNQYLAALTSHGVTPVSDSPTLIKTLGFRPPLTIRISDSTSGGFEVELTFG
jgi:hypothetical protein